ncbi:unnamed protein product [Auanema sp. JU1783]|nr:unnamed protein product [Auanema sp. JU1783]
MQDYVVVIIAVTSACCLLAAIILTFLLCRNSKKTKQKQAIVAPVRKPSILGVHPKIPDPIFTIPAAKSTEKDIKSTDTLTTRKLSMMFDARKRFSSAFNQRQSYFDFENSPQPRHKEYLDFNDIQKILPTARAVPLATTDLNRKNLDEPATCISIIEECPFGNHDIEPVREVFSENHVSFRRERPHVG